MVRVHVRCTIVESFDLNLFVVCAVCCIYK